MRRMIRKLLPSIARAIGVAPVLGAAIAAAQAPVAPTPPAVAPSCQSVAGVAVAATQVPAGAAEGRGAGRGGAQPADERRIVVTAIPDIVAAGRHFHSRVLDDRRQR